MCSLQNKYRYINNIYVNDNNSMQQLIRDTNLCIYQINWLNTIKTTINERHLWWSNIDSLRLNQKAERKPITSRQENKRMCDDNSK